MWLRRSIRCFAIVTMIFIASLAWAGLYKDTIDSVPISFSYPDNWQLDKSVGKEERYQEVYIKGPRDALNTYNTHISVVAYPEGRFSSVLDMVRDYKDKYSGFKGYQLLYSGEPNNPELEIEYIVKLPLYSQEARDVKIKERIVFLKKERSYFKLKYSAVEADYPVYLPKYHTLVETFQ